MSAKYTVIYSPKALEDLRHIYIYIAFSLKESGIAKKLTDRIKKEIHSLNFMPERHPVVDRKLLQSRQIRKFPVGNYVVYYEVVADSFEVKINRILGGGQNAEEIIGGE